MDDEHGLSVTGESLDSVTLEVRLQRALAVVEHQVKHGTSVRAACEACNVSERTFYRWVQDGILADYLVECRESRATASSAMAAESLPDVMKFMIELASGKKVIRGANPIAAAEFVWRVAQAGQGSPEPAGPAAPNVLAFIPQVVTFNVINGVLVVGRDGRMEVIEGEARVVDATSARL